jgi:hypothetical protein
MGQITLVYRALVVLLVFFAAPVPRAQGTFVVYDGYRNGAFDGGAGFALNHLSTTSVGMRFTAAQSGHFESVNLPVYWGNFGSNGAAIALRRDDAAGFPGSEMEHFTATQLPPEISVPTGSLTFSSSLRPYLSKSEKYWLVVSAPADGSVTWFVSLDGSPVFGYRKDVGLGEQLVQWAEPGAFRINATPVPEPKATLLIALAVGIACLTHRPQRSNSQR